MVAVLRLGAVGQRAAACPVPDAAAAPARPRNRRRCPLADQHGLRQQHPHRAGAVVPRRRGNRAPLPRLDAVERRDDGAPRAAARHRRGRPHLVLRILRQPLRGRLQLVLPRQGPPGRWRPPLHSGPRLPRYLRPRVPGGPAVGRPARRVPPGVLARRAGRRPAVVPAPAADAGLLGIPHRVHGLGPDERDLPGAVRPLPARSGHQGHQPAARVGVPGRRRDERAGVARAAARRGQRRPGQPHLRDQLQPAAAGRPGPRQRQDHPGAGGVLPRRGLERDQGDLGPRVGRVAARGPRRGAGEPDEHHPGRRLPDLQGQRRGLRPGALLRARPAHQGDGQAPHR